MTALLLVACSQASAQTADQVPGFDLERIDTNTGRGTLLVGNGELMVPGGLSVNLVGHYQLQPLVLNDGSRDLRIVQNRVTSLLGASYGLLPWLEVGAQVPFVLWQKGDSAGNLGLSELAAQGLGTPVLQARLGVLSQRRRQPLDLAADVGVGLPVGNALALAGDDGPRFHARMTAGLVVGWLQPSLEAGVLFRPKVRLANPGDSAASGSGASSEVRLGAALATTGKGFRGELAWRAIFAPQVSMEVMGGVRFPLLSGLEAFVLGGPGLGAAQGTPILRVLAGVSFRSEPPPRIAYLDERADQELQLVMATTPPPSGDNSVRATPTWELQVARDTTPVASSSEDIPKPRPYQPRAEERVVLRGELHFAPGSAELPGVAPLLDQAVQRMSEQAVAGVVVIEGYADAEGQGTNDMIMSLRRAQAVRRYLIDQGVPATRIRLRALGSDWPVSVKPATEQEQRLNRRAQVLVITEPSAPITTQTSPP
ncbi:OmpA family protein [Melittangium boletus]|uniref:OmpA family protein n=1 Tax=Melittangium boletus TaxID=83453 RepID=UPI003DA424D5